METEIVLDDKNLITMKLLHYFITEKNYNPIILQGVENEIWLENLNEDCKVVRIVSSYIHNDEQYDFDVFKTKRIIKKIKKKTFSLKMNVMSIFLDLGDNVKEDINVDPQLMAIKVKEEKDLNNSDLIKQVFPDLVEKMEYNEKGAELFIKITNDINKHNIEDASRIEEVFRAKVPYVTYSLIVINLILFFIPAFFGSDFFYNSYLGRFCVSAKYIRAGEYWRLFTAMFMHGSIPHVLCNCYSLYVIGTQIENFYGKVKYLIIYIFSGFIGCLFSMLFLNSNAASLGASGAIFGLMGALLYFGYHYRVYLGQVIKSQILPLILLNLGLGFMLSGIDNSAHIGGLIGGLMMSVAVGVNGKSSTFEKTNGWIISIIFTLFICYLAFFYMA